MPFGERVLMTLHTAWRMLPAAPLRRPRALGCCFWSTGHLPSGPAPRRMISNTRGSTALPSALGRARNSSRLHHSHAEHRLRRRDGRALHVLAVGNGGSDQRLLDVGELANFAFQLGDPRGPFLHW